MPEDHQGELTSKHIVAQQDIGLAERVGRFIIDNDMVPKLAILCDNPDYAPSQTYIKLKKAVGSKLGIEVEPRFSNSVDGLLKDIYSCNKNPDIHGVIVQLPLKRPDYTDEVTNSIKTTKDVDGLGSRSKFSPATPQGILTLLDGYGISYKTESTVILGQGRLVGAPLLRLVKDAGATEVEAFDEHSVPLDIVRGINNAHIIISAMGKPGALTTRLFYYINKPHVVIDAGAAEQDGLVIGDVSDELREQGLDNGWLMTPVKGGIGPLTVRALLTNVVQAAENQAKK